MALIKILLEKNEMKITKEKDDIFHISFDIRNEKKDIMNFISIDFIKLIHDLNPAIFESIQMHKINESEANIIIVYKDLFMDLGLPHYYSFFKVIKNCNTFNFEPLEFMTSKNEEKCVSIPLTNGKMVCTPLTDKHIHFEITMQILPPKLFSIYAEKMVSMLFYKAINRVKQFIYNIE